MPTIEQGFVIELARNLRAFLSLRAGVVRGVPEKTAGQLRREIEDRDREIASLRARLLAGGGEAGGVRPERVVWVFGVARTGSSWLSAMMADMDGFEEWPEPYVGEIFGHAYYARAQDWMKDRREYVLSNHYRETWHSSIRNFVLEGANARFPGLADGGYLVIKEPNGSIGAPLLSKALPESRVILLVRDPRDVVASLLAANRKGSWSSRQLGRGKESLADTDPDSFVRQRARMYMNSMGKAKEAYENHRGPRAAIRYENLRYRTLETMERAFSELGISWNGRQLEQAVARHAWENVPEGDKGADKPRRKAKPGGWREDLTPAQVQIVEEITSPMLREFYSDAGSN